jgi:hypothetical protein
MRSMRLPGSAHGDRAWRIHAITGDFRLEDVWALPTPGGPDDFRQLVDAVAAGEPSQPGRGLPQLLWAIRWELGKVLGWDGERRGLGGRVASLRERLPADLRGRHAGPDFAALPFSPLYLTDDEFAAEIANATMHGVLHLGWVPDGNGAHRGQLAVLFKPNGPIGDAYMAAIKPFRHLIVYPAMLRQLAREWPSRVAASAHDADPVG